MRCYVGFGQKIRVTTIPSKFGTPHGSRRPKLGFVGNRPSPNSEQSFGDLRRARKDEELLG